MPTAFGKVNRPDANTIKATFPMNGKVVSFTASVNPAMEDFESGATLTYSDMDELVGTHSYSGAVGKGTIKLNLDNGPALAGPLNSPSLDKVYSVSGRGSWQHVH
ncbi:hypothetical protein ACGFYU_03050 [Streptomyces sp. NPDC048337]|uniref:hypothetical protein n=1 Tax=Streptomyces sp. NPDC048337 TaxID=3365535 RepID=UPI00371CD92D